MVNPIQLLVLFLLICLNGVLAMAEISIVSSRKLRLQQMSESGIAGAEIALKLATDPGNFLSAIQIGITGISVLNGLIGAEAMGGSLQPWIAQVAFLAPYSAALANILVVVLVTYLSLVIGELAPKQIGLNNAERIASALAPMMQFITRMTMVGVKVLSLSTALVLRVLGVRPSDEPAVTEEEVKILIGQGTKSGVFEPIEEEIVRQVFRLSDQRAKRLLIPRMEVVWLDIEDDPQILQKKLLESGYNQFPVGESSLDNVLGFVRANDLLAQCMAGQPMNLRSVLQEPLIVPESMPVFQVLQLFREKSTQIALVIDEFGGMQGMLTPTDILEAIVGELADEDDLHDPDVVEREDGSWLLDGMLPVEVFKEIFHLPGLPQEDVADFQTLAGFVITYLARIPKVGDRFTWEDWDFEIMDMDGHRVDKVLVRPSTNLAAQV